MYPRGLRRYTESMLNPRFRPVVYAGLAVAVLWVATLVGYSLVKGTRVTPEKVSAYVASVDLSKLSAEERAKAIQLLADKLNALSYEDRRRTRLEGTAWKWFEQMTEAEKSAFVDKTMPTGFKQMLSAFEQMPDDRRRRVVDNALRRLREAQSEIGSRDPSQIAAGTNGPPPLSPELQAKIRSIGLKSFYSQSSAQTKAELAPVLEELQRVMASGRMGHW